MKPAELVQRFEALRSERSNLDSTYDLIDQFVAPNKGRLWSRDEENSIEWRERDRYEDTAVLAAQTLASSMHGAITNPAHKWFSFRFRDLDLNDSTIASEWLQRCEDIVFHTINDSNFTTEVTEYYLNDVAFGTAIMTHLDMDGEFRFKNLDIKGVYFEEDFQGKANGLFYEREYTALQLAKKYPDTCPESILAQAKNPNAGQTKHEVIHAIYFEKDNSGQDTSVILAAENRPFQEMYILKSDKTQLSEPSGYYEFPAYVLRWGQVAGSKFGYSPAINSLGNILTVNQLVELVLRAAEKAVDPNILTLDRGIVGNPNLRAGGRTNVRSMDAMKAFESKARFDVSQIEKRDLIQAIRQAFFVDQLELKESPAMTATEVNVRYELMQRLIGPPVARVKSDFLDLLLQRSFYSLSRNGVLPQPPAEVIEAGAQYDVEYVGSWSRSQKMDEVASIEGALQSIMQLQAIYPEVMDILKMEELAKDLAMKRGMPAEHLREDAEIKKLQVDRQEQMAQQQQMAMLQQGASAMKDIGASGLGDELPTE